MSLRPTRRTRRSIVHDSPSFFSSVSCQSDVPTQSNKKVGSARKIRRTQEMVFLDLTCEENVTSTPLRTKKGNPRKSVKSNEPELPTVEESAINETTGRRKIVKAKRFLKKKDQVEQPCTDEDRENIESSVKKAKGKKKIINDLVLSEDCLKSGTKLEQMTSFAVEAVQSVEDAQNTPPEDTTFSFNNSSKIKNSGKRLEKRRQEEREDKNESFVDKAMPTPPEEEKEIIRQPSLAKHSKSRTKFNMESSNIGNERKTFSSAEDSLIDDLINGQNTPTEETDDGLIFSFNNSSKTKNSGKRLKKRRQEEREDKNESSVDKTVPTPKEEEEVIRQPSLAKHSESRTKFDMESSNIGNERKTSSSAEDSQDRSMNDGQNTPAEETDDGLIFSFNNISKTTNSGKRLKKRRQEEREDKNESSVDKTVPTPKEEEEVVRQPSLAKHSKSRTKFDMESSNIGNERKTFSSAEDSQDRSMDDDLINGQNAPVEEETDDGLIFSFNNSSKIKNSNKSRQDRQSFVSKTVPTPSKEEKRSKHSKSAIKFDVESFNTGNEENASFAVEDRSVGDVLTISAQIIPLHDTTDGMMFSFNDSSQTKNSNKKLKRSRQERNEDINANKTVATPSKGEKEIREYRKSGHIFDMKTSNIGNEQELSFFYLQDRSVGEVLTINAQNTSPEGILEGVMSSFNNSKIRSSKKRSTRNKLTVEEKRESSTVQNSQSFDDFSVNTTPRPSKTEVSLVEEDTSFSADRSVVDLLTVETIEIQSSELATEDSLSSINQENTPNVAIKNKSSDFLTITTLPSPISPSERSIEDVSTSRSHLNFKSSQENLFPSTSGTTKRRTYELEDSVIDVSSLKSLSERDYKRMSSVSSNEYQTPEAPTFSKITTRRRWNKSNNFSPVVNSSSPAWLKHDKTPECILITDSAEAKKSKKFVSKVKMPNFAAIHQKALDKIENLSEYRDRKELRAKMLLAGLKPQTGQKSTQKTPKPSTGKESRKQLRFAPGISERVKSPTFIPLPSTPKPRTVLPPTPKANVVQPPTPKAYVVQPPRLKLNVAPSFIPPLRPFLFQFDNKENQNRRIPVLKRQRESPRNLKPFAKNNAFTFKGKNPNAPHMKEIKSLTTKSKTTDVDAKEVRRCAIKGVRSNRRFELLMNMRKGK